MFIFPAKDHKKYGVLVTVSYFIWAFIIILLVIASWLFLFVYNHLYFALIQETAIANLKSELIITKVNKQEFDNLIKNSETKNAPLTTINFKGVKNPFKTPGK